MTDNGKDELDASKMGHSAAWYEVETWSNGRDRDVGWFESASNDAQFGKKKKGRQ
jgi:hypothetical protein